VPSVAPLLRRDGYGWMGLVRPRPCSEAAQLAGYDEALGAGLAVLHAVAAVDVHYENVIACGDRPVLVDLERLFHPRVGGANADAIAPQVGEHSASAVLRVGLLPAIDVAHGVDLSAMAGGADGRTFDVDAWDDRDGTGPRLTKRRVAAGSGSHRPVLGGDAANAAEHVAEVDRGFTTTYRLLMRHRAELLRSDGPAGRLADVPIRVLLRHSRRYSGVLFAMAHPDGLREEAHHRDILAHLRRGLGERPDLARVIEAELEDIGHCDVPRFGSRPGSSTVYHHARGPIAAVLGRHHGMDPGSAMARLGERDLGRQRAAIRGALTARDG